MLLVVRNCSKLSSYAISRKTNKPNFRKWQKKTNFGPNFSPFGQDLGSPNYFHGFYLSWYLDIVPSCHPMQFTRKRMNQTCQNGKKPNFGPPKFFLRVLPFYLYLYFLDIVASYHFMQLQGKLINQI